MTTVEAGRVVGYADAVEHYLAAGWAGVLPLPNRKKKDPPAGYTGWEGRDPTTDDIKAWRAQFPDGNVALRLPDGVVGVDLDLYKPQGRDSYEQLVAECGPLPPTWVTTSRTDGSGIRLYRVPRGTRLAGAPRPGIEIVQHHHRYAICWPSIHPDTGALYLWDAPVDDLVDELPTPDDLPLLLDAWIVALAERPPGTPRAPQTRSGNAWSKAVEAHFGAALRDMVAGCRHDVALERALALARLDALDHPGAGEALEQLGAAFVARISDRAAPIEAEREWVAILDGARRIVATTPANVPPYEARLVTRDDLADLVTTPAGRPLSSDTEGESEQPTRLAWQLPSPTIRQFLDEPEPDHVWRIPGLVEEGDRIIVTGGEGSGKSTLLRQIGVQAAAGVHPFTLDQIPPVRTVILDLENSRRHVRRSLRPLNITAGEYDAENLFVSVVPEGIDLMHQRGLDALDDLLGRTKPELVIVGPLYKLASGDPKDEEQAQAVRTALDGHRATYGCALIIEAHQPYASGGSKHRPLRPYGASLWSRWPEFGLNITDRYEILHWRGQRDERAWPAALKRGGEWPWTVQTDPRAVTFARILDATRAAGQRLSVRALADALTTPTQAVDRNQIQRSIDANKAEYEAFIEGLKDVTE